MNDNPKWKPFLDAIPDSLHPVIKPVLQDWDKGVQEMVNGIHAQYEPYKEFVDRKVNPIHIEQGLDILGQITQSPENFMKRVDEAYNLNLLNPPQAQSTTGSSGQSTDDYDEDFSSMGDITKHPLFQEFAKKLEQVQETQAQREQRDKEAEEQAEFEKYLDTLGEQYKDQGGINRELVTAYMSQGLTGEQAVKAYQDQFAAMLAASAGINQNNNGQDQGGDKVTNPPDVMGSTGTPGSGLPDSDLKPGTWNTTQTNDVVAEMLRAAAEQQ